MQRDPIQLYNKLITLLLVQAPIYKQNTAALLH